MYRSLLIAACAIALFSCENASFNKDKRQIVAKNVIHYKLPRSTRNFDITGFREDTLATWTDTTIKRPIRYTLDYVYTDSTGAEQKNTGFVLFTPDGRSMITAQINNPNR